MNQPHQSNLLLTLANLQHCYATGTLTPSQVVEAIATTLETRGDDGIWITTVSTPALRERAAALEAMDEVQRQQYPLWGIPFSVKDCIDIAGLPTTSACPAFSYDATQTNPVVQTILDAGAILIGKTNLDQFATGLVGLRTGYTVPHNAFSKDYIPGGSSSGAVLSVAVRLVSFAIGTDTGGSGRVPAAVNNIVGLKPTKGLLNTQHTVEACKTLDCLSIFALTTEDAYTVFELVRTDPTPIDPTADPTTDPTPALPLTRGGSSGSFPPYHSRSVAIDRRGVRKDDASFGPPPWLSWNVSAGRRGIRGGKTGVSAIEFSFGVPQPDQRQFFGNADVKARYEDAIATLSTLGGTCIEIDYTPFLQANELLFNGAWVAERYASVGRFIEAHPDAVFPITREIITQAKTLTAVEAFEGLYAVEDLKHAIQPLWDAIDCLVVPTTGTVYRIDEIEAEPLKLNANLGYYTNFVNLLDLCAIALPNGFQSNGIPTGITLIAPAYSEAHLTGLGSAFRHVCNPHGCHNVFPGRIRAKLRLTHLSLFVTMLRIRYSKGELDIEGSVQDFMMLRSEISKVTKKISPSVQIVCDTDFDPSPYVINCGKICIILGSGPNYFNVSNSVLRIEGASTALENLSDNLPCSDGEYDGTMQYHCHYDAHSFPDFVSNRSPEVVLSLAQ